MGDQALSPPRSEEMLRPGEAVRPEEVLPAGWSAWRRLLRGPLRPLIGGQVLGQAGDGLAQITFAQVALFEVGAGATPWEITKLLAVTLLPFSLVGPLAGVLIDRWDRRRTMILVSLFRVVVAVAAVGVLVTDSQALAYLGILVLLSASRFVVAAKGAALPRTVAPSELVTANGLSSIAGMTFAFTAAVTGSLLAERVPTAGFLLAAALYAAAAASFARLPGVGGGEGEATGRAWARLRTELVDEVRAVARNPGVRRPLVAVWAHRFLLGYGFVLLVLIADHRYGFEASGYGLALAVTGVGAFLGTWSAPNLALRFRPRSLLPLTFLLAGLVATIGGFRPDFAVLVGGIGLVAVAFQILKVLSDALIQDAAPDLVRGRVVSVYDVGYNVAFVLAGLVLVPLWDPDHQQALLWLLAAGFTVAGLALARALGVWPYPRPASARPASTWVGRVAAVPAGALLALAFPEVSWWWLGFVGLVPLLVLVVRAPTGREAGIRAWLGGAGFFLAMHHWLVPSVGPFTVPLALLLGLLWIPWGRLARATMAPRPRLAAALVLVPAAWVAAEFVRSWDRLGGPWGVLGASQWNSAGPRSLAALGGVWLISAVLVAVNVAIAAVVLSARSQPRRAGAAAMAAVVLGAGALAAGALPGPSTSGEVVTVAGVQSGIVPGPQARFDAHVAASFDLAGQPVDLVVWGESSVGLDLEDDPGRLDELADLSADLGADLLVNVDAQRGEGGIFKSAVLVGPDGVEDRYDKRRLVPFGEFVPLRPLLGPVADVTRAADEDRQRGEDLVVMDTGGIGVGPLVCFESTFPDLSRKIADDGADLVVLQTATTTFQGSWAHAQHASLAALRAVESGRPMVHAALSGNTAAFDAEGNRLLWMDHDERGAWVVDVPLTEGRTVYVVMGDWVPMAAFAVLFGAALGTGLVRARRSAVGSEPGAAQRSSSSATSRLGATRRYPSSTMPATSSQSTSTSSRTPTQPRWPT